MTKNTKDTSQFNNYISTNKQLKNQNIKTTNINILLNRVRLDKKETLKKRIIFSFTITILISTLAAYFVI